MPHVLGDMSVRDKVPTRTALRTAVRDFRSVSLHPVLDCPDINRFVKTNISDGQILQWDATNSSKGEFVSVNPASVNVTTSPLVNEIFLSNNGSDTGNDGKSLSQPFLTFQRGIYALGRSDAYDQVALYINGDVDYNPTENYTEYGGVDRLREGSFGGNLSRGVVIRGLKTGEAAVPLNTASAPRNLTSQLLKSQTLASIEPGQVTQTAGITMVDLGGQEICSGYTIGSNIPASKFPFFRDNTGNYFPVAWDANIRQSAGTPNNRFFIASHDGVLPNLSADLDPYNFAGKVIVNNEAAVTNPSFSMGGNIQFVEVHFELQDGVKTPYHVNGQFVILFSKFSKSNSGNVGSTLELASYGSDGDHTSTLQITTGAPKEGGRVIQIKKSIFENLTIKFDTVTEIEDCVFDNCIIQNPQNVVMSGCILYNSKGVVLGDKNDTHSFKSSLKLRNSGVIYGTDAVADHASHFTLNDASSIELESVLILPGNDVVGGVLADQTSPICIAQNDSTIDVNNVKIALEGTNQSLFSSLFYSIGGRLNLRAIDVSAASTSVLPLILCDGTDVTLYTFANSTVNTNSLIQAISCNVKFKSFQVYDALYTVASGAVFQFKASNVTIDGNFNYTMNSGVTTTLSIFDLYNSQLSNYPNDANGSAGGHFNIQNEETQHSIRAWGSNLSINLGDNAVGNPQRDLHGGIDLTNSTLLLKENVIQNPTPYKLIYQGTSGKPCLNVKDSRLTMENIDILALINAPTLLNAADNSVVLIKTSNIQVMGNASMECINVDRSVLTMEDCNVEITNASSVSSVRIQNSSTFNYSKVSAGSCLLNGAADANNVLLIQNNSNATLKNVNVTCNNSNAIQVDMNSSLTYTGEGDGTDGGTDTFCNAATATTGAHSVISALSSSKLYIDMVKLYSGGGNAAGVTLYKCSEGVFKNLVDGGAALHADSGVVCVRNSKFHADTNLTSNFTTGFYLGTKTISWADLQSNSGVAPWGEVSGANGLWDPTQSGTPQNLFSISNWNAYQQCNATMS